MRILSIATDHDRPEAEMLAALHKRGFEIHSVLSSDSKYAEFFGEHGIEVTALDFRTKLDFNAIKELKHLLKSKRFDICHTFSKRALSNALFASRGLPLRHIAYRGIVGNLSRFDPFSRLSFLNPRIDRIVCVCKAIENYMLQFSRLQGRVQTIYKGHCEEWYQAHSRSVLSEFGIPVDARVACCVANARPRKGLSVLLEAVHSISLQENIHLLVLGRGMESYPRAERIHFGGFRPDAPAIVGACDLVVMPSLRREGLPKAVLEGMWQGVPAVVTTAGGLAEIVEDGISGRVVEPGEPGELALAIQDVLAERATWTAYSDEAKKRMQQRFAFRDTVEAYEELYHSLVDQVAVAQS